MKPAAGKAGHVVAQLMKTTIVWFASSHVTLPAEKMLPPLGTIVLQCDPDTSTRIK